MILYGIEKAVISELDPTTGKPPLESPKTATITTAEEATLTPVYSEGSEEILRSAKQILAVVRTDDLLYGLDLTLKDNKFGVDVAEIVCGYKATKGEPESTVTKLSTPNMAEGNLAKPFKLELFIGQYEGDALLGYVKITLNKCIGKFVEMKVGKEFFAPEFEIKARENTKAKLPIQDIEFVKTLE